MTETVTGYTGTEDNGFCIYRGVPSVGASAGYAERLFDRYLFIGPVLRCSLANIQSRN